MPNECFNTLKVRGKPDQLKTFYSDNSKADKKLLFSLSVPINEKEKNWYEKRKVYWSTKLEAMNISSVKYHNDKTLTYEFTTAWSPPLNWLLSVSEKYMNLNFNIKWYENITNIKASMHAKNGTITKCRNLVNEKFPTDKISEILKKLEASDRLNELQKDTINYSKEKIQNAKNELTRIYFIQDFFYYYLGRRLELSNQ
jgi:hypothetical protein